MKMLRALTAGLILLLSSACTLEPEYVRPSLPVPDQFTGQTSPSDANQTPRFVAELGWRAFFKEPQLRGLIQLALANNRDARVAALNVAVAREQYRVQRADLFPTIDAAASETAERVPLSVLGAESGGLTTAGIGSTAANNLPRAVEIHTYDAGLGFTSYELDVFGRIRSLSHASLEEYFADEETQRSTTISLVAEVADAYMQLLADQELLRITADTLKNQEASYNLSQHRFERDTLSARDLKLAEISVQTARANLAQYQRQLGKDINALTVLLGAPIPPNLIIDHVSLSETELFENLPAGLPSDLVLRRPDLLSAEHKLKAANANIGAARAAFFPSITLTAQYGSASSQLSGLFKSGSSSWSFSPQFSLPIFAGGANIANLNLAKVEKNIYIAQYEKAIQIAFQEVNDALVSRATLDDEFSADVSLQSASQTAYQLSNRRYEAGIDSYLNVLDSQRTFFSAEVSLVNVRLSRLENLVSLYKALGGGWEESSSQDEAIPPRSPAARAPIVPTAG